jgi:hypothetical protein
MTRTSVREPRIQFDRVAAVCAALVIIGLVGFLLVRNEALASPQLFFALRVVLSFATAVLGATIPGFLDIGWKGSGLALRAGGALALFVLTFVYTPDLAQGPQTTISAPGGVAAGTISGGSISVGPQPTPAPTLRR